MRPRVSGSLRWPGLILVAWAGVLAGHMLGYGVSGLLGAISATPHAHLDPLADVLVPLGAIALTAIAATDPSRSGWRRGLTVPRLAGVQSVLYLVLEWGERAVQGHGLAELLSLPVIAGFVAQLVVAVVVVSTVRLVWRATRIRPLVMAPWPRLVPAEPRAPLPATTRDPRHGAGARAPPVRVAA